MSATQLKKVSWWHQSIVDWELNNPGLSLGECAQHFGVTQTWLSIIRNSDVYRSYEMQRRAEHNGNVSRSIVERVEGVAEIALEVLEQRISSEREKIGLNVVNDTCNMALKALGFGNNRGAAPANTQVNVFVGGADKATLSRARERLRLVNDIEQANSDGDTESLEIMPAAS